MSKEWITDPKTGNEYKNMKEMCDDLNINYNTFLSRKLKGWSVYDSLYKVTIYNHRVNNIDDRTDHLGNVFDTKQQMCDNWNVNVSTYNRKLKNGVSKKDALTTPKNPSRNRKIKDHLGNVFETYNDLYSFYKVENVDNNLSILEQLDIIPNLKELPENEYTIIFDYKVKPNNGLFICKPDSYFEMVLSYKELLQYVFEYTKSLYKEDDIIVKMKNQNEIVYSTKEKIKKSH